MLLVQNPWTLKELKIPAVAEECDTSAMECKSCSNPWQICAYERRILLPLSIGDGHINDDRKNESACKADEDTGG